MCRGDNRGAVAGLALKICNYNRGKSKRRALDSFVTSTLNHEVSICSISFGFFRFVALSLLFQTFKFEKLTAYQMQTFQAAPSSPQITLHPSHGHQITVALLATWLYSVLIAPCEVRPPALAGPLSLCLLPGFPAMPRPKHSFSFQYLSLDKILSSKTPIKFPSDILFSCRISASLSCPAVFGSKRLAVMAPNKHQHTISTRRRKLSPPSTRELQGGQHGSIDASATEATRLASLDEYRAELQDNHLTRTREVLAFRDKALALVEELKETCRELLHREEACLDRLDRLNPTASELAPFYTVLQRLRQPIPERLAFAKNGLMFYFAPEEEENEDQAMEFELDTASISPSPAMSAPVTGPGPSPSDPSTMSTSATRATEAQDNPEPSTTLRERRARISSASTNVFTSETVATRRLGRPKHKRRIKPREVKSGNYWVFEHGDPSDPPKMYILRCPKVSCQNPVFSRHPLKANRAVSHFKACGVRFKSLSDLVGRYADLSMPFVYSQSLVVPGRVLLSPFCLIPAHKHNTTSLIANHAHVYRGIIS